LNIQFLLLGGSDAEGLCLHFFFHHGNNTHQESRIGPGKPFRALHFSTAVSLVFIRAFNKNFPSGSYDESCGFYDESCGSFADDFPNSWRLLPAPSGF
jgi:hypothetical protein